MKGVYQTEYLTERLYQDQHTKPMSKKTSAAIPTILWNNMRSQPQLPTRTLLAPAILNMRDRTHRWVQLSASQANDLQRERNDNEKHWD